MNIDLEKEELAAELKGSFLYFCQFFYRIVTGRDFIISQPIGRESHHITVARTLTQVQRLEIPCMHIMITMPPGSGKSTLLALWIAWCWAHDADCNFIYVSYAHELAAKHTAFVKSIVESREYGYLFDVYLKKDSRAKDKFATTRGGTLCAFGSAGAVTGQDAGLQTEEMRFTGALILDDPHKPDEAHSQMMREKVITNYKETMVARPRGPNVPTIMIGQRVHEADLAAFFMSGQDLTEWEKIILKSLDEAGNALHPEVHSKEKLLAMQEKMPYVFASQFQQNPIPPGGSLFKEDWFFLMDEEPEIICTFLTIDSAETSKTYNDPTAMSFFGIYEIEAFGKKTGEIGLHWLDCIEVWVEPMDLEQTFMSFWLECSRHKVPPLIAGIEKKSTGVTLISSAKKAQGLQIREIQRTAATGGKTVRFLEMQPFVASNRVSLTHGARHLNLCIDHMLKITANETHRHDDIADTLYDGIKMGLIDQSIYKITNVTKSKEGLLSNLAQSMHRQTQLRMNRNGQGY
ncbi:MAG: hypothetical protein KA318_00225 [Nitrosomonas sp.]|nr:hypothetical protein [Nitrosomonas sp.]